MPTQSVCFRHVRPSIITQYPNLLLSSPEEERIIGVVVAFMPPRIRGLVFLLAAVEARSKHVLQLSEKRLGLELNENNRVKVLF